MLKSKLCKWHGLARLTQALTWACRHPEEYEKKIEESKDKSESAEKERRLMEAHTEKQEAEKRERSWRRKMWHKLRYGSGRSSGEGKPDKHKKTLSKPGQDVESGIAPSGKRESVAED